MLFFVGFVIPEASEIVYTRPGGGGALGAGRAVHTFGRTPIKSGCVRDAPFSASDFFVRIIFIKIFAAARVRRARACNLCVYKLQEAIIESTTS